MRQGKPLSLDRNLASSAVTPLPPLVLFPLSYALHIAEETWGGESFPVWASQLSGVSFTHEEFLVLNGVAFGMMCLVSAIAARWTRHRGLVTAALGTIVAGNGALHMVASLWSATYSPGVVSGAMVWLPLGVWALRSAATRLLVRQLLGGCAVGVLAHAAVSAAAFFW